MSTTVDLVWYYSMLLDGSGGLPPQQANIMVSDLAQSTPTGIDGYPQRFGIPDGLFAESVAKSKQGWMCCWNGGELAAHVYRRCRPGPPIRDGDRLAATRRRRDCPKYDHRDTDDNVPGRPDLVGQSSRRADLDAGFESAQRLLPSPLRDLGMVSGQENSGTARSRQSGGRV